jgi:membrane protein implicated in regulation of membrane protease activity
MRTLRKLVLGETWALPIGIAVAVGVAAIISAAAGSADWWEDLGGFVLLSLLVAAFAAGLRIRR